MSACYGKANRDEVEVGLAVNGRDPEQASCWFSVGDVHALWRELDARGIGPGVIDEQEYDGKPYRIFFAKDAHGVCFCSTQPA
jgi:lactoylglutathione lyase